jgi:hypothetical protein
MKGLVPIAIIVTIVALHRREVTALGSTLSR